ncbi:pyridoxal 5'-phosphate synthase glutaminase subunit PdxT [Pontimonas sp.]|uniref:pyridoxal 5'-phosphate synthase glutaminase subunit PdxT n=1 Tax=Pontimonas sp. TaxID=2304492 RepID=UPI0028708F69|nr:pyridoxal 5'-phosphate synthase glutaminase subunit PdxT [Pontimonas sp.]MDR9396436.1 pyridoxal 5'-phosphate synthase glutaminase subunit PdxT [Pontimonas sp.]MDR9434030.1 pyridoxal 5'-phosphate synthase glutaminase subunit PdxT [Pontimonas sp.]
MGGSSPVIGILALQGDVREHRRMLESLGATVVEVRAVRDLAGLQGLVIPGGESSVMDKLTRLFGLTEPLRWAIDEGLPVLGTCAGMIMLANELADGIEGQETLGGLDISVQRNAFGAQRESFDTRLDVRGIEGPAMDVSFIRAPIVTRVGDGVDILASLDDARVVAVDNSQCMALAFHPEVSGDERLHAMFVARAREYPPLPGDLPTTLV